jgi:ectoine hydroxylase-related dioxygenase (phytanoyl-CoA dioxygenase family)
MSAARVIDWFGELAEGNELPQAAATALNDQGFSVLRGIIGQDKIHSFASAYDAAFASANGDAIRVGSTTTRVNDFFSRGLLFEELVVLPPLLESCCRVIGRPFKLSSFVGRTVRPGVRNQELHVDVRRDSADWPLLGFIFMIDDFRPENGATRFVPGSHRRLETPEHTMADVHADHPEQTLGCGVAGSLLVFNGSVWHGHTANTSTGPRRSLQGAFIPREGQAATDFAARVPPEMRSRLDPLARYVLAL